MIPAWELAQLQADAASVACDQTCVIQRPVRTPDGAGTKSRRLSTIATTVAGLSEPTAGQLQNYDFKIGALAAWQVKLPIGTNVLPQDILTIGGQAMEVQVDLTPRSYATLMTILATKVK